MLKELLADACAAVLGLLEFADPVVDGVVKVGESFFLLEHRVGAEFGCSWRAQVVADAGVEVASAGSERRVCPAEVICALV